MAGKRSIFEEVGTAGKVEAKGGMIARTGDARGAIRLWLVLIFLMVAAMVMVGGLTRLTDSGLSITEWRPVMGALPPMSDADWAEQFAKYQASPQFKLVNSQMALPEFKAIFWWEWAHRNLGRLIGLVWTVGFFGFLLARKIPAGWTGRLLGLGVLGGLQGAVGWWMVSSGLSGSMVSVASYRLAIHLGLAFAILGLTASYVFELSRSAIDLITARRSAERRLYGLATGVMHLVFLQILLGALVAGIDAGRAFPTWPDMNGAFFPADAFVVDSGRGVWAAFFENDGLVQFIHRMCGYLLFILGIVAWNRGRRSAYQATRGAFNVMALMLVAQVALGIWTALSAATLHVAITHQVGALILWVLVIRARHMALYPVQGSIREGTA